MLEKANSLDEVVAMFLQHFPVEFVSLLGTSTHLPDTSSALREAIQVNPLFVIVQQAVSSQGCELMVAKWRLSDKTRDFTLQKNNLAEWLTILLLTCPKNLYKALKPELQPWINQARNPVQLPEPLNREAARLQEQMDALQEFCSVI